MSEKKTTTKNSPTMAVTLLLRLSFCQPASVSSTIPNTIIAFKNITMYVSITSWPCDDPWTYAMPPFWLLCTNGGLRMWFHIWPETIAKQNMTAISAHICLLYRKSKLLRRRYRKPPIKSVSIRTAAVAE
uniref:Putative secreted protein n=1 Tax=Anopheles triannulatus TaxID=58253 RepID=A0A2M4B0R9_9DIPT